MLTAKVRGGHFGRLTSARWWAAGTRGDVHGYARSFTARLTRSCEAAHIARRLVEWRARATQRRVLAMLNDHILQDIGLSRADVEREVSKPFWRA